MSAAIESIPELSDSILVRVHHDEAAGAFEADCRPTSRAGVRLLRLRCDGVTRVDRWLGEDSDPEQDSIWITRAYHEPLGAGRVLLTLDLEGESEWIEVDCRSMSVSELGPSPH